MSTVNVSDFEYLCAAAVGEARERRHPSVGTDHLLFVICQTEEGRRTIERCGGRQAAISAHLEASFVARNQIAGERAALPFTEELREVIGLAVDLARARAASGRIQNLIDGMLVAGGLSEITRSALVAGGLGDGRRAAAVEVEDLDPEALLFDAADIPKTPLPGTPTGPADTGPAGIGPANIGASPESPEELRLARIAALRSARLASRQVGHGPECRGSAEPGEPLIGFPEMARNLGALFGRMPGAGDETARFRAAAEASIRDLSTMARAGDLDPLVGRHDLLERMVLTLSRRRKRNLLVMGDPGVGKTALIEGLAMLLNETLELAGAEPQDADPGSLAALAYRLNIADELAERPVLEVSLAQLLAGAKYRGEFEGRLTALMAIAAERQAIVFIDEFHTIVGAGSSGGKGDGGGLDASNILKPALARGEMIMIGATTYGTESRGVRKDGALMRRFTEMAVKEPNRADTLEILSRAVGPYALHHELTYGDDILDYAVEMAGLLLPERFFPDKAFDVVDLAGTYAHAAGLDQVRRADVRKAAWTLSGVRSFDDPERRARILGLDAALEHRIFGQSEAIAAICRAARIAAEGLVDQGVAASYLFNGPTGVGKSALARAYAEALDLPFMRIDLSEFMEKHAVARLIGAPPGYVGFDADGLLTKAAETHREMVLLLDEADKAHRDIFDILLQVIEEGALRSGDGRVLNLRGWHIILAANLGADPESAKPLGFGRERDDAGRQDEAVKGFFRKELLSRIGAVIGFARVDGDPLADIARIEIEQLVARLARQDRSLEVEGDLVEAIVEGARRRATEAGTDRANGRDVRAVVREEIADGIARAALAGASQRFRAAALEDDIEVCALD